MITAHQVHDSELKSVILDFVRAPPPKTAENIASLINDTITEFDLRERVTAITTDNDSTNILAFDFIR